jgi:ornithine--oxo-acid transaminase
MLDRIITLKEAAMLNTQEIIQETERWGAHNYHPLPIVIEKGEGIWVEDVEGNRYMDMLAAYSAVNQGHRHPKIIEALIAQAQKITLTSRAFHNDQMGSFLHQLCNLAGFDKALPMNTGAEAVETAIKAIRKWALLVKGIPENQAEIIVCANNFGGRTVSIISFSTEMQYRYGFGPFTPGFTVVPFGDAEALENAITPNTAATLFEPIQGEAGVVVPPAGYLSAVRRITEKHNILMALDEIQTGFGRTGRLFAYQHEDIKPDIVLLGKALGGGIYPVSAMLSSETVMAVFNPGDHGSTFGGNPLAAAVGKASLDVLVDEKLSEKASELGAFFIDALHAINSPYVREIRGKGLFVGVEIKQECGNARFYCEKLMELGILCKETHQQTIRFAPPLVITKAELEWALERIQKVLTDPIPIYN